MPHTAQPRTDRFLDTVDPLPHPERMRQLAEYAAELARGGELRPVLEELAERGPYGCGLAVVAASVGRDTDWIAARLDDPDRYVRGHALRAADSLGVPDSAFEAALEDASAVVRRDVTRHLAAGRRPALADLLIARVRATWGEREAARLLPGCGTDTVRRLLPGLFHAVPGWNSLARRHPVLLLDALEADLAGQPEARREAWWARYGNVVALVLDAAVRGVGETGSGEKGSGDVGSGDTGFGDGSAEARGRALRAVPGRVIELLGDRPPARLPEVLRERFGTLAAAEPERLLRLLLTPFGLSVAIGGYVRPPVRRRLARNAPWDLVVAYGRALTGHHALLTLMEALPPSRRAALHLAVVEGAGEGAATLDETLLRALPRTAAAGYARRMADRARALDSPWSTIVRADAFLPHAEVREGLIAATHRPVAEDRALAWNALIRNAAHSHDPAAVDAVLAEMARLRNEQDPVRSAALTALAATPAVLFRESSLPHLDRILTDASEARDASVTVRVALSALAVALLRTSDADAGSPLAAWALRTLVRIARHHGEIHLGGRVWRGVDPQLGTGREHLVVAALLPVLEPAAEKGDHRLTLTLAQELGRLAHRVPALGELLWRATRSTDKDTARAAIESLLAPPAGRGAKVARLLAQESAAAVLPSVLKVLTTSRTDLLDQVLGDTPPDGRFQDDAEPWHLPVGADARRWVARQHHAAARQLGAVAGDDETWDEERATAILRLAALPGIGADEVRRWTGDPEQTVADAALAALAVTDRPADALPELLALADTDRARAAVYAATGASLHARPSLLTTLLGDLLDPGTRARTTSTKEAVRLAALRLPLPEAVDLVTRTYATPGRHRDVRAACVTHAVRLLDDERTWEMLVDAATGGVAVDSSASASAAAEQTVLRAAVLSVAPGDIAGLLRPRYARLVREVCRTDDVELAGAALGALGAWEQWLPGATDVLVAAVTDLADRRRWRAATDALVACAPAPGAGRTAVHRALEALATAAAATEQGRDLPARGRLSHLVGALCRLADGNWGAPRPEVARPALWGAGEVLAGHQEFVPHAADLLVRGLDLAAEPVELGGALARLGRLLEGRPASAVRVAGELKDRIGGHQAEGDPAVLLDLVRPLTEDGGYAAGLLAVAITDACGGRTSWAEGWWVRLGELRRHGVWDVRDAARGVWTGSGV